MEQNKHMPSPLILEGHKFLEEIKELMYETEHVPILIVMTPEGPQFCTPVTEVQDVLEALWVSAVSLEASIEKKSIQRVKVQPAS